MFNHIIIIIIIGFPYDFTTSVRSHTSQGLLQHYITSVMVDSQEILINFIYSACYLGVTIHDCYRLSVINLSLIYLSPLEITAFQIPKINGQTAIFMIFWTICVLAPLFMNLAYRSSFIPTIAGNLLIKNTNDIKKK